MNNQKIIAMDVITINPFMPKVPLEKYQPGLGYFR